MYLFTIVPFLYFLKTRLKGKVQRISWIFIYFIPAIFLFDYFAPLQQENNLLLFIIGCTFINYIYENGYIQNDVKTIKREINPTLRLSKEEIENINEKWYQIILLRLAVSVLLMALFYVFSNSLSLTLVLFSIGIILQFLYLIYNSIRNIWNFILILPINYIRFYGFILPFVSFDKIFEFIIVTILLYPLAKVLEFTRQTRYNLELISKIVGNIDSFRVKYYLVITMILSFTYYFYNLPFEYLLVSIYFTLFRIATYIAINKNSSIQNEMLKNTKKDYRK